MSIRKKPMSQMDEDSEQNTFLFERKAGGKRKYGNKGKGKSCTKWFDRI